MSALQGPPRGAMSALLRGAAEFWRKNLKGRLDCDDRALPPWPGLAPSWHAPGRRRHAARHLRASQGMAKSLATHGRPLDHASSVLHARHIEHAARVAPGREFAFVQACLFLSICAVSSLQQCRRRTRCALKRPRAPLQNRAAPKRPMTSSTPQGRLGVAQGPSSALIERNGR